MRVRTCHSTSICFCIGCVFSYVFGCIPNLLMHYAESRITVIIEVEFFPPFYPITSFGTVSIYGGNKLLTKQPYPMIVTKKSKMELISTKYHNFLDLFISLPTRSTTYLSVSVSLSLSLSLSHTHTHTRTHSAPFANTKRSQIIPRYFVIGF